MSDCHVYPLSGFIENPVPTFRHDADAGLTPDVGRGLLVLLDNGLDDDDLTPVLEHQTDALVSALQLLI